METPAETAAVVAETAVVEIPAEITPVVTETAAVETPVETAAVETEEAPKAKTRKAPAKKAVAEVQAPVASGNRYAKMITADMTKPVVKAETQAQVQPTAMDNSERPLVISSERPAGSASARQMSVAPMTKPGSVE
nr:hypothetical protein [Rheinheimera tangshanensis]